MAAMNAFARDLPQTQFIYIEALRQTEAHVEKPVVHTLHADANSPAILFTARLRVAGHRHTFHFVSHGLPGVSRRLWTHSGSLVLEVVRWISCARANMSSSAKCH